MSENEYNDYNEYEEYDNEDNLDTFSENVPANKPTIDEVIAALQRDDEQSEKIPTTAFYGLSDLDDASISGFEPIWRRLDADYKRKLVTELVEASEVNFDFNYEALGFLALDDSDPIVRSDAIDLLWINESSYFMSRLIDMAENDDSSEVRARAVSELGRFILLGEYEEISESEAVRAQDVAIGLLNDEVENVQVRRRALEAISNSSLDFVNDAIQEAYEGEDHAMKVSSIYAMGRSYDQRWNEAVLREMHNDDPEIRYEATRAAGELEIQESVTLLGQIAIVDEREIKQVAIWSLGEIGGSQATRLLTALAEDAEEAEDEDLQEAIEDALGYASMVGSDIDLDFENSDGNWN